MNQNFFVCCHSNIKFIKQSCLKKYFSLFIKINYHFKWDKIWLKHILIKCILYKHYLQNLKHVYWQEINHKNAKKYQKNQYKILIVIIIYSRNSTIQQFNNSTVQQLFKFSFTR
jgi:hypothetical protein